MPQHTRNKLNGVKCFDQKQIPDKGPCRKHEASNATSQKDAYLCQGRLLLFVAENSPRRGSKTLSRPHTANWSCELPSLEGALQSDSGCIESLHDFTVDAKCQSSLWLALRRAKITKIYVDCVRKQLLQRGGLFIRLRVLVSPSTWPRFSQESDSQEAATWQHCVLLERGMTQAPQQKHLHEMRLC